MQVIGKRYRIIQKDMGKSIPTYEDHECEYGEEADGVEDEGVGEDVGGDENLP